MGIIQAIIMAASLCADCLAVSICSSVTIRRISTGHILKVALAFAVIQTAMLFGGWAFGNIFVGMVEKVAHILGFMMLLYVGGSMLVEGLKGKSDPRDLNSLKKVIAGGIATSMDALAVGVSQSMDGADLRELLPLVVSVFVITAASVVTGIYGGRTLGCKFGFKAEAIGGIVLILIGVNILLS